MRARALVLALLAACGSPDEAAPEAGAEPTRGPLLGQADGTDASDRACRVVLRDAGRRPDGRGGYETRDGGWLWAGTIDVAEGDAADARPAVLYRSTMEPGTWWSIEATAADGAPDGYRRFTFELAAHLPGPGLSGTALSRAQVELIPVLLGARGERLFDHNRLPGDLDNYRLDAGNGWSVGPAPEVCPATKNDAHATLSFAADRSIAQDGALVAGGQVTIEYALERLSGCHSTHNGHPAWDLRAFVRFFDAAGRASEPRAASVRRFEAPMGVPHNVAHPVPATFAIPASAVAMEAWFVQEGFGSGTPCRAYDSNDSRNYRFDVLTPPGWMGNAVVKISRAGGDACDGGTALGDGFTYDSWGRTRAVLGNVCFSVWKQGVTDRDDPDLWRKLDVRVHHRFGSDGDFISDYVPFASRTGNDARFAWDVRALDPFRAHQCPATDVSTGAARLEFFFTVNGAALRADDGRPFVGTYVGEGEDPWRAANCD